MDFQDFFVMSLHSANIDCLNEPFGIVQPQLCAYFLLAARPRSWLFVHGAGLWPVTIRSWTSELRVVGQRLGSRGSGHSCRSSVSNSGVAAADRQPCAVAPCRNQRVSSVLFGSSELLRWSCHGQPRSSELLQCPPFPHIRQHSSAYL